MGAEAYAREGPPLLERAIASVRERGLALKGPTSTPAGHGVPLVNIALRKRARPVRGHPARAKHYAGVRTPFPGTDVVVVRMNPEDLYAGIEYRHDEEAAAELRRLVRDTRGVELSPRGRHLAEAAVADRRRRGSRERAFEYARANGRRKVTAVHKATVMRYTDGVFLEACREVAAGYPDIEFDDRLVDNVCHQLVCAPRGLRRAAGADHVRRHPLRRRRGPRRRPRAWRRARTSATSAAVFEAVHGSAPRHAGQNRANPFALMLSGVMLLRHVGEEDAAARLEGAIAAVIAEGRTLTYDLKPSRGRPHGGARTSRGGRARSSRQLRP